MAIGETKDAEIRTCVLAKDHRLEQSGCGQGIYFYLGKNFFNVAFDVAENCNR